MGKKYDNPPIIEALCEFQFAANTDWPLTNHGEVHERLKHQYPKVRNAQNVRVNASVSPAGISQQASTRDKTLLFSEDEKSLVQVAPYLLVVNRLKPYISWEAFSPRIHEALGVYREVCKPEMLQSAAIRYINQIEFGKDNVALDAYFDFRPHLGPGFKTDLNAFAQLAQFFFNEGQDLATVQLASLQAPPSAVLLDIEYSLINPEKVGVDGILGWIDDAHFQIETLFEACIKDDLRAQFE